MRSYALVSAASLVCSLVVPSAHGYPPAGYVVMAVGTVNGSCVPNDPISIASVNYEATESRTCSSTGKFTCTSAATGSGYLYYGEQFNPPYDFACWHAPVSPAPASGAAFDLGNSAHGVQAMLALTLVFLGLHGYSVGARE